MKKQSITKEQEEAFIQALEQIPIEQIYMGQCASICSCFVSGAYLSATCEELIAELLKRHKGMLDKQSVESVVNNVLAFGIGAGALIMDSNDKYAPTEMGWAIGQDWDLKMRLNDFGVGV